MQIVIHDFCDAYGSIINWQKSVGFWVGEGLTHNWCPDVGFRCMLKGSHVRYSRCQVGTYPRSSYPTLIVFFEEEVDLLEF